MLAWQACIKPQHSCFICEFCEVIQTNCFANTYEELHLQRRIRNPVQHLRWNFFAKIVNG